MPIYKHSHFGVYAVIMRSAGQEILLIKKARGSYTDMYDLPGGSMEDGELLEETLIREVKEETSCDIKSHDQIGAVSAICAYKKDNQQSELRHIGVLYRVKISGTPMETGDGEDSHGCVWMSVGDLTTENSTPFVLEAVKKP